MYNHPHYFQNFLIILNRNYVPIKQLNSPSLTLSNPLTTTLKPFVSINLPILRTSYNVECFQDLRML